MRRTTSLLSLTIGLGLAHLRRRARRIRVDDRGAGRRHLQDHLSRPVRARLRRSGPGLHCARLGRPRHHVRPVAHLSGQAAARRVSPRARGRRRPPEDLGRPQDVHLHAAQRLSFQRRHARPGECLRTGDPPDARTRASTLPAFSTRATSSVPRTCWQAGRPPPRASRPVGTRSSSASSAPRPTSCTGRRRRSSAPCRRTSRPIRKASASFPAAGPYYVAEYRPGERVLLRRNRFYRGTRPHHVDGFDVDFRALSPQEVRRPRRPRRRRLGVTRPQGSTSIPSLRLVAEARDQSSRGSSSGPVSPCGCSLSTRRGRSSGTTRACARRSTSPSTGGRSSTATSSPLASVPSDQYLPPSDARLQERRHLPARACGSGPGASARPGQPPRREGRPLHEQRDAADGVRAARQAAARGDRARRRRAGHPAPHGLGRVLHEAGNPRRAVGPRARPLAAELRRSVRVPQPAPRRAVHRRHELHPLRLPNRTTGRCGKRRACCRAETATALRERSTSGIAREAAPMAAVDFLKEPTLVSERVGCIVLRPVLDLTAVCLK